MKYNSNIDFFGSPNCRFIGFSDIRHPQPETNQHHEVNLQSTQEEKKIFRKLSFCGLNNIEPIIPLENDFFNEKLQECSEPSEYSQQQNYPYLQQNSLMMCTNSRTFNVIQKPALDNIKQPEFQYTDNTMRLLCQDMPQFDRKQVSVQSKMQSQQDQIYTTPKRKSEFSMARKSCESTAQKAISRNNEKGLRRLSSLAFSIVSQSTATTYKQVAQKLLGHLNFSCSQMEEEDGAEKSSMQNVKRRVYDSLNVLLALGVIKRVGTKIARQKQKKPFCVDNSIDVERYNQMLQQYKSRVKALEAKKRTQSELKEKLQIFKKTVERNKKTKQEQKNKLIRLPFLAFVGKEEGKVEWVRKESLQNSDKKKILGRRGQAKQQQKQKVRQSDELGVKIMYKGYPESYGDLDFFSLLQHQKETLVDERQKNMDQVQGMNVLQYGEAIQGIQEQFEYPLSEYQSIKMGYSHANNQMMSLIDEVFEQQ